MRTRKVLFSSKVFYYLRKESTICRSREENYYTLKREVSNFKSELIDLLTDLNEIEIERRLELMNLGI